MAGRNNDFGGMRKGLLIASVVAALAVPGPAAAATLEQIGSFEQPVFVTSDPGNADRLFVVEQGGRIILSQGGATSTFADLTSLVLSGGERGLLSMAFATDFATSGRFYVYYTSRPGQGDIQVDEFTASGSNVDLGSRRPIITIPHRDFANHNGGQLQIGPDGMLYLAPGDGGSGGDPDGNAQNLNSLLGKILRIDPRPTGNAPYSIPPGNPFVGTAGADEIWSYGLRNPYRFSFDRGTGAIAIGDVGQSGFEEVDYEPGPNAGRGDNFGWDCREGRHPHSGADPACAGVTSFTEPIFEYSLAGANCAITGGYVVRDQSLGDLYGRYVYADYCAGAIRSLVPAVPDASDDRSEGLQVANPSSFGEDACGRLYVVSHQGPVYRFVGASQPDCSGELGPALTLSAPRRQDIDRPLRLRLASDEPATAISRARLIVAGEKGKRATRKTVARLPRRRTQLSLGEREKVRWRLSRGKVRRVRRQLRAGRVTARFSVRASDAAGNISRETARSGIVR
jgi:glucose/arabinose dehydrogenase